MGTRTLVLLVAVVSAAAAGLGIAASSAWAQSGATCSAGVGGGATVTIAGVRPDPPVAGTDVVVRGEASAPFGLDHVELFVDGTRVDSTDAGSASTVAFDLRWPGGSVRVGPAHLRVVACGGDGLGGSLVQGEDATLVLVGAAPTPPSVGAPPAAVPSTAAPPSTSAGSRRSTTTTARSTTTTTLTAAGAPIGADGSTIPPDTSAEQRAPRALQLTRGSDKKDRPPLWVGAVVGVSGLAALTLSAAFRRRWGGRLDSADPDLV